ncbi:hypothetical protein ACFO4E_12420 [Nocardiopsis mangrovi]|uniref:DUF8083 domain-containing protein n=1 Tax=Nocardiopsis mangrovi TaxID=1179818 RepID=A0ABV9DW60_9ACTN
MLPYTAYLRVYQPIAAFSLPERRYWRAYAESADRPRRVHAVAAEHAESLRRLVATPPIPAPEQESRDAYVRRMGGELYICPWQTRLRSWLGLRDFHAATPAALAPVYLPDSVADAAERDFEEWRDRGEPLRTQILTSTWTVPLPWFAPFEAKERCLILGVADPGADGAARARHPAGGATAQGTPEQAPARTLLYVTEMALARERLDRAIQVLQEHVGESAALVAAERLDDWLSGVAHPDALIELDYGGLVHLLGDDRLREDESVAEIAAAITGLETGQEELAVAMYRRVTRRWKEIQALEHAN